MTDTALQTPGTVTATARLNIRAGKPFTAAAIASRVEPGTKLKVVAIATGESVHGNNQWYQGENQTYFWSGVCSPYTPDPVAETAKDGVRRRENGTILPLTEDGLRQAFGDFAYTNVGGGRIEPAANWATNIVPITVPVLAKLGVSAIHVHRMAATAFHRVFAAIESAGLDEHILTFGGTYVPRHIASNNARPLSSHSWGVAIDLNVAWNGYGCAPAAEGAHGSVCDLLPHFAAEGFAWGGHFSTPDGMHFELARTDLVEGN